MEFKLLELVKASPILYAQKYRNIRYRYKRLEKWDEIASQLGRDASSLRIRWKTLRDTYRRLKKLREEGEDVLSLKYWRYYDHMDFLDEHYMQPRQDESKVEESTEFEIMDLEHEASFEQNSNDQPGTSSNEPTPDVDNFDIKEFIKKVDRVAPNDANTAKLRSIRYEKEDIIAEACQEMSNLLKNANNHFTPPSANQLFFNSVAAQVEEAKLPAINVMRLQQRILEVVTQEIVLHQEGIYEEV